MSSGDISSTSSLDRGNGREILREDVPIGTASSNTLISIKDTELTTGNFLSSPFYRGRPSGPSQ